MHPTKRAMTCLLLLILGCESGPPEGVTPDEGGGSYVVTAKLEREGSPSPTFPVAELPAQDVFTVHIAEGAAPRLIASRGGSVGVAPLARDGGGWKTGEAFGLGFTAGYGRPGACQGLGRITYESMELVAERGSVRGTFKGHAEYLSGDVAVQVLFKGTLAGVTDRQPPTFAFESANPHPAELLRVLVSEALPAGTRLRLVGSDGTSLGLRSGEADQPAALFYLEGTPGPRAGYRLVVEPAAVDLGGNTAAASALPVLDTLPVPLVPQDGFEGAAAPYLEGTAAVVGAERFPPITGQRSLFFPGTAGPGSGARVSARLAVPAGARTLRATVRQVLDRSLNAVGKPQIAMVVPGQQPISAQLAAAREPYTAAAGGLSLAASQTLEIALPEGATGEVMLDIQRPPSCGLILPTVGLLIDDLRVE
jgi:hypothetical protein